MRWSFLPASVVVLGTVACSHKQVGCGNSGAGAATTSASDSVPDLQSAEMQAAAPAQYCARFETSAGSFVVEVTRAWAPRGADRFYNLVRHGFYNGNRFFRVLQGFVAQFGINGNPDLSARWRSATIPDDPVRQHNLRGTITFATAGPNTRTTQLFINFADNTGLDSQGFAPFGRIVEGMDVVDRLYSAYGEMPDQGLIQTRGNAYLTASFPKLDSIARATVTAP